METVLVYPVLFVALYFEVFLLISFLESRRIARAPGIPETLPTVTVFVPCYNEEKTVAATLDSLLALDYPADKVSIFAVNDGSTDGTAAVLAAYENNPRVRVFHKENGGKHTALNLALSHSTSDVVGCLDADSFVAPDALRQAVRYFSDPKVMAVTPTIRLAHRRRLIERIQHAEYALSAFMRRTFSWLDAIFITPGPFSLFRRRVFMELGPYRAAHNTEDMEIALRMQASHMKIENAPEVHVFTNAPRSCRALFKQRVRWTYGFLKNAQDYRFMFFNPRYGTLGLFILPLALLIIFPTIYFAAMSAVYAAGEVAAAVDRAQVVGITIPEIGSFDWFFLNTNALLFITFAILGITSFSILTGMRLISEKNVIGNMCLYLALYGFLAPWWLCSAIYSASTGRTHSWRREIDARRGGRE